MVKKMDLKEVDYKKAVAVVRDCSSGSVSNIQRKLSWGYALAASAIDRMQSEFIVSPMSASGRRDVYPEEIHELWRELQKAKNSAVSETLKNDCMIGQTWFMKNTPVSALIKYAENIYKSVAISQNSKIEFGTDDNKHWWAHDVPFYGEVQLDRVEDYEWDIHFNDFWQGPFNSKDECIRHLEECIAEQREEIQGQNNG